MLVRPVMDYIMGCSNSVLFTFTSTCLVALFIVFVCIVVHFLLSPIWNIFDKMGVKLQNWTVKQWSYLAERMAPEEK